MEEEEYIETDVRKIVLHNLKELGLDAEFADGTVEVEKPPYTSGYFSGLLGMMDNLGTIRVTGKNFDYIHIVRRG